MQRTTQTAEEKTTVEMEVIWYLLDYSKKVLAKALPQSTTDIPISYQLLLDTNLSVPWTRKKEVMRLVAFDCGCTKYRMEP